MRQKPATEAELLQFAARLRARAIRRGAIAALDPNQKPFAEDALRAVWEQQGVLLDVFSGAPHLLITALTLAPSPLDEALAQLPHMVLPRLRELESSADALRSWASMFEDPDDREES